VALYTKFEEIEAILPKYHVILSVQAQDYYYAHVIYTRDYCGLVFVVMVWFGLVPVVVAVVWLWLQAKNQTKPNQSEPYL
jgi:hypothetical protein